MQTYVEPRATHDTVDTSILQRINREVQAYVDQLCGECKSPRVLDAGSGSRSHIRLSPSAKLVGLDISPKELSRHPDLDEAILGDVQTYPLAVDSFDLIVCWDVLEHVQRPLSAMENFSRALRPGGLLIIGSPVVHSLKGFVTKFTPLWFHSFVFQYLVHGGKRTEDWESGPFRTFLRSSMAPEDLRGFAQKSGLRVEHIHIYEAPIQRRLRRRHFAIDLAFRTVVPCLKAASLGRIDPDITDFVLVLKKPRLAELASVEGGMARSA